MANENYPAKSYKLFWLLNLVLLLAFFIITWGYMSFFPQMGAQVLTKIILCTTFLWVVLLFAIIYKTGRIYWIPGISYDEAKKATEESRNTYAKKHLKLFVTPTIIFFLYCILGIIFSIHIALDIVVFAILIFIAAFKSLPIKL